MQTYAEPPPEHVYLKRGSESLIQERLNTMLFEIHFPTGRRVHMKHVFTPEVFLRAGRLFRQGDYSRISLLSLLCCREARVKGQA